MDDTCPVADLCQAAGRLTRTGGRFALVYRPERLAELFAALQEARLEPKRLQLLAYDRTKAPYAVLVEAVRGGAPAWRFYPPTIRGKTKHKEDAAMAGTLYLVATPSETWGISPSGWRKPWKRWISSPPRTPG